MAGRRKKAAEAQTDAQFQEQATVAHSDAVASTPEMPQAAEQEQPPTRTEKKKALEKFTVKPRPGYGGELHILPDGSMARLEDHGNDAGLLAQFIPPEGMTRPEPDVTEPLKEHRSGHSKFGFGRSDAPPRAWKKQLKGLGLLPAEERADGDNRFSKALEARKKHAEEGQTR